jgi:hypothetical protein
MAAPGPNKRARPGSTGQAQAFNCNLRRNNGAKAAPAQACDHTRRRIIYYPPTHSPFALMHCRICGVFLGRLLRLDPQHFCRQNRHPLGTKNQKPKSL